MTRPYNFSAGPALIPEPVLEQAAAEMLNWRGSGMGVMEMSHRGKEFMSIYQQAQADFRALMAVPPHFQVLFMQGGGIGQNAIVPLNLSRAGGVDFVVSGSWSKKSLDEAARYCRPHTAAVVNKNGATHTLPAPQQWRLSAGASYLHLCSNETIDGLEFQQLPDLKALGYQAPLVIDCSSHIGSRAIDWSRVGLAFAGAQKNLGPAGLTVVVVREDLIGHALPICPSAFDFRRVADNESMFNTPPTWAIYIAGLVFAWMLAQREGAHSGVAALEQRNIAKAKLLYDYLDNSSAFYNPVAPAWRSRMNVPFFLRDAGPEGKRYEVFLSGAKERGLLQLKGHKSVGGLRASIYNAMPLAGVQALVAYLQEFEQQQG